ncbi:MAG TPA: hypothetical protein VMQ11_02110, partial [Alphaproteobacteria bacterium]|nr:hypothetical protein [Alphaproteobacteria bacterium]
MSAHRSRILARAPLRHLYRHPAARLWALAGLLIASVWAGTASLIVNDRAETLQRIEHDGQNLAVSMAEQTDQTLVSVDLMLRTVQLLIHEHHGAVDLQKMLGGDTFLHDQLIQVVWADANGDMVQTTLPNSPLVNIRDREHFRVHAD